MNWIKKHFSLVAAGALLFAGLAAGLTVAAPSTYAQDTSRTGKGVCAGLVDTSDNASTSDSVIESGNCDDLDSQVGGGTVQGLISNVLNIFSWAVGAISVIMLIVGGFRYIVSGGDTNAVSGAKNTILYAIVGLVIVIFAQVLVKFVITNLNKSQS